MKKHYFFAEFAFLSIFFFIPPLFASATSTGAAKAVSGSVFSYTLIPYFVVAVLLSIQNRGHTAETACRKYSGNRYICAAVFSGYVLVTFGELCITAAVLEWTARVTGISETQPAVTLAFFPLLLTCFAFLISSFSEEVLYRVYLPDVLYTVSEKKLGSTKALAFSEILSVLVFALSHRYLGIPAVINAGICGIFLRICYKKSGTVFAGFAAHFLYNIFMFILSCVLLRKI